MPRPPFEVALALCAVLIGVPLTWWALGTYIERRRSGNFGSEFRRAVIEREMDDLRTNYDLYFQAGDEKVLSSDEVELE